ncbi:MAG: hypothetical protein FWC19_09200 [Treponema sp.]|nr:hypothetical protein [Treponema sp.]MCL2272959.1 hypothetical protein [Treponema sp.]
MKKYMLLLFSFVINNGLWAQVTVSGILDSSVSMRAGGGDALSASEFSCGIEEYANIRFQARIRDRAVVYGAFNLIAAAGDYAAAASQTEVFIGGENYIAAIELERLYFRLRGEYTDFDGGLFRLPFGYGQVFGPSDFLNPRNPLKPDARLRGILGAALSWYPVDTLKLLAFSAAPRNVFQKEGEGWLIGVSMDQHFDTASLQALYSFETPKSGSINGMHRIGLSVKADVVAGFYIDTLYTYNYAARTDIDGLSASAGADYSFLDGKMIVLAEYLYNGETSSTAIGCGGNLASRHYLYAGFTWSINDFTNAGISFLAGFDDLLMTPIITFNHDLFQGAVLSITSQIPFDSDSFYGVNLTTKLRLRF